MCNSFATTINCMDGRVQKCVNDYIEKNAKVEFVDAITMAGPSKVIHEGKKERLIKNIKFRLNISLSNHGSSYIAVVGHHDCAGVKVDDETQKKYVLSSAQIVKNWYPNAKVEALWINKHFQVEVLDS